VAFETTIRLVEARTTPAVAARLANAGVPAAGPSALDARGVASASELAFALGDIHAPGCWISAIVRPSMMADAIERRQRL